MTATRTARKHRLFAVFVALAVVASACSITPGNEPKPVADLSNVSLGEPLLVPVDAERVFVPLGTNGTQWFEIADIGDRQFQPCVVTLADTEAERICASSVDFQIHADSVMLTADGGSALFTSDLAAGRTDPDIWEMTLDNRRLENRTDDGVDELWDEQASLDLVPFSNEAGEIHFFTAGDRDVDFAIVDDDGTVRVVRDIEPNGGPGQEIRPLGDDRFIYVARDPRGLRISLLDLTQRTNSEVIVPGIESPFIAAAGEGFAIIGETDDLFLGVPRFDLVDLDTGRSETLDIGNRPALAFAASPNGSSFVALQSSAPANELQLIGFQRDSAGTWQGPFEIAPPGFLGLDDSERPRTLAFRRVPQRFSWTADNRVVVPTADNLVLVFDVIEAG